MNSKLFLRRLPGSVINSFLASFLLALTRTSSFSQDIVLSDFEQPTYAWLPGGVWTSTGTCFGSGPAHGALAGQQPVAGYLGGGLVNTFLNGDATTGTLTSPSFIIHRRYIRFLIGGGNWKSQTCLNLLVNGQVERSAVGMGDREHLDWVQWELGAHTNQTAQLQIVDKASGAWGHINVDQIIETDTSLPSIFTSSQRYLNLPVQTGARKHLVELLQNGLVVREMNVELAETATNFWAFIDLTPFLGHQLQVRVDSQAATTNQLATQFIRSNIIVTETPIYQEPLRPLYHYTARRGWLNDPNGMLYYGGEYHLFYQHNPYDCEWDNMHWGHAVSADLVHWAELPEAIYPNHLGAAWSGSSVVDWSNTAGFGSNAIVSIYTLAAGHDNNPRMSMPYRFTQGLAYSLDNGRTFINYTANPVVPHVLGDNRDPRVIWDEAANKWCMALWLTNHDFGFFSSTDLKHWTQNSTFTFPGVIEVPELFPLPLNGDTTNLKWIFYAGAGHYYVGRFDGNSFTAQYGPFSIRGGNSFAAGQTFNNIPASDGRRILVANGTQKYPGMPFNEAMGFPVELTLRTTGSTPRIHVNPVREIVLLRTSTNSWPAQPLPSGTDILAGTTGEAFELNAFLHPGASENITFNLRGTAVVYDNLEHQVTCSGISRPLNPVNGVVRLRMLVDRGTLEIYANDGLLYMPMGVTPIAGAQRIGLVATGSDAQLLSLNLYGLGSVWSAAPRFIPSQPGSDVQSWPRRGEF